MARTEHEQTILDEVLKSYGVVKRLHDDQETDPEAFIYYAAQCLEGFKRTNGRGHLIEAAAAIINAATVAALDAKVAQGVIHNDIRQIVCAGQTAS